MSATHIDILRHLRSVMAERATDVMSDQQLLESFLSQRSEAAFAALAESGGKALLASKMKWALAVLLAASMAAGGVLTHQSLATKSATAQPEVRALGASWCSLLDGATTDKEGRFRLAGIGRGVEMEWRISAPTIETQWIKVKAPAEGPAVVEVLSGPTKPVEGTVRGRDTGKPLSSVEIRAAPRAWMPFEEDPHVLRTVTDQHGHYRLLGLPKAQRYELTAVPPVEQGYVITAKRGEDSEGLKPVRLDFDLRRGVIVSGMWPPGQVFAADRDGRFRVEGLLPDRDHELILEHGTKKDVTFSAGNALKKLKIRAGKRRTWETSQ